MTLMNRLIKRWMTGQIECCLDRRFKNGSMLARYVYNDWMYGYIIDE